MSGNLLEEWSRNWSAPLAHPNSPAGGAGAGFSRTPGPAQGSLSSSPPLPNAAAPAARHYFWQIELPRFVFLARARAVYDAITEAPHYMRAALLEATGQELHETVKGIVPGLLMFVGVLATTTALGSAAGAAVGALAFGIGAIPGAAIGGELGLEGGVALLGYLGLAFLAVYIGKRMLQASLTAGAAIKIAWHSVDHPSTQHIAVQRAAHRLAFAVGLVFRGILQGVVAFLVEKGAGAISSRVPELVANLRKTKLGAGFAEWVETNWRALLKEPKLKRGEAGEGTGSPAEAESGPLQSIERDGAARRDQAYKDIDAYENTYKPKEDAARQAGQNSVAGGYKAKVTEAIGERSATQYMEANHPDFVMDQGFKPGQGFDQVYTKYDPAGNPSEMMIVEAKGPGATLSTNAAKGPQMSQEWVENTVSDMVKSNDEATASLGKKLQAALDDGEPPVIGKVIEANGGGGASEVPLPDTPDYNGGRYN